MTRTAAIAYMLWGLLFLGCDHEAPTNAPSCVTTHEFSIHWPPIDPNSNSASEKQPLLRGDLTLEGIETADRGQALAITMTIRRPTGDPERQFWNSQLAYADLPWMDDVRVWDADSHWQWPNLPFLLRLHGQERVERYGGIDPGKGVDNDFAAVLIRRFDALGEIESDTSRESPFVSAKWYGDREGKTDIHSLVHVAKSERFVVDLGKDKRSTGRLKLWLIYADFLGSRPPASWPREGEWAGGVLSYCEIDWEYFENQPPQSVVRFLTPPSGTGFDWEDWCQTEPDPAPSRLSD